VAGRAVDNQPAALTSQLYSRQEPDHDHRSPHDSNHWPRCADRGWRLRGGIGPTDRPASGRFARPHPAGRRVTGFRNGGKGGPPPIPGMRRSFDAPLRAPAVATGDPELDPLVSYLKASFAVAIKDGHRLVIEDTTNVEELHFREPYQHLVDGLLNEASDQVPTEMIRAFGEKNRQSRAVWPELAPHLPATLVTAKELDAIFVAGNWNAFYAKYPGSPGLITVSRVGLDREKTLALFYVGLNCGGLCGHGQLHVLKKEGDVWIELPVQIGPSWVS
jgi:hypothetical protein